MNPDELINGLRGLKEPVEIPEEPPPFAWQPWVFGSLGVIVLGFLIWLFIRHRKKQAAIAPATEALKALTKLSRTTAKAEPEGFVMDVSTILRGYVEKALGVQALRLSTEEFLEQAAANNSTISTEHRGSLKEFLQQCDLVKFAKGQLDEEHRDDLVESARRFVRESSAAANSSSAS